MSDSEYDTSTDDNSKDEVVYSTEATFKLIQNIEDEEERLSTTTGTLSMDREDVSSKEEDFKTSYLNHEGEEVQDNLETENVDDEIDEEREEDKNSICLSESRDSSISDGYDRDTVNQPETINEESIKCTQKLEERLWRLRSEVEKLRVELATVRQKNKEEAEEIETAAKELEEAKTMSLCLLKSDHECLAQGYYYSGDNIEARAWERVWAKRKVAAEEYKEKLGQVEALCNAELGRLEAARGTLEPLNRLASSWTIRPRPLSHQKPRTDYFLEMLTMNVSTQEKYSASKTSDQKST